MSTIDNYEKYNSGMKKSIKDKLFFEGLIDDSINTFVDFGCADGQILKQVHADFPDWNLRGIDSDPKMIELARQNCPVALFESEVENSYCNDNSTCILNMSSIIHELYSYLSPQDVKALWTTIFNCEFKYISIRDIMISKTANRMSTIQDVHKVYRQSENDLLLHDFESKWGRVIDNKTLIHYLLKYRYIENWEREVRENYLPITVEDLIELIPNDYEIVYFNHYVLPFTRDKIMEDFGIELKDNTHIKILLKRRTKL
jgi:ribosomal protein L11 methylase PrmA